ncbi:hypothetical protein QYM36_000979 [Artemia franciscana]|uniref:Uncharacterized protein n=1 Tax=Artemia franciscana TaxID=6661 RepID=A0AA88IM71_ARTSF|nr:hypothetical protein QYM36_000979 [Artemia franciscana]
MAVMTDSHVTQKSLAGRAFKNFVDSCSALALVSGGANSFIKCADISDSGMSDAEKLHSSSVLTTFFQCIGGLPQGENIAPGKVKNIYQSSIYVAQVLVHVESLKLCVVAVAVPDISIVKKLAQGQEIEGTVSNTCANPTIERLILEYIQDIEKRKGLKSIKQAKDIYLHPD